jgi:phosphoribosylformylglycinamidine synthase
VSEPAVEGRNLVRATVLVRPKQGILDPQGQAVQASLEKLGFSVDAVRIGRVIDLEVEARDADDARNQLELMCDSLLANPLIESFEVQLGER